MPDPEVDVARLTFEASGRPARDAARRISSPRPSFRTLPAVAIAFITLAALNASSTMRETGATPAGAILARKLAVIEDWSGSMSKVAGTLDATDAYMRAELDPLRAVGAVREPLKVQGFGVKHDGGDNFLNGLKKLDLTRYDGVYLFSDFEVIDDPIDGDDARGFAELRALLKAHRLRLYIRSVRYAPAPELLTIAKESGGDYIKEP